MSLKRLVEDAIGVGSLRHLPLSKVYETTTDLKIIESEDDELGLHRRILGTDAVGSSVVIAEGSPIFEAIRKMVSGVPSGSFIELGGPKREIIETTSSTAAEQEKAPQPVDSAEVEMEINPEKIAQKHHMDVAPVQKPAPPSIPYESNV